MRVGLGVIFEKQTAQYSAGGSGERECFHCSGRLAGPFPWEIERSVPRMGPRPVLVSCALEEDGKKVEADMGIEWREK